MNADRKRGGVFLRLLAEFLGLYLGQAVTGYLLFDCLCTVRRHPVPIWRKVSAAALEQLVFWLLLFGGRSWQAVVIGGLAAEGILLRLVWGRCTFWGWLGVWAGKLMLTILWGGVCLGTALLIRRSDPAIVLFAGLGLTCTVHMLAAVRGPGAGRSVLPVGLSAGGSLVWMKGLYDTGNCLYDGTRRIPVSILNRQLIKEGFPELEKCLGKFLQGEDTRGLAFHYLPYKSLGCPEGMLICFTADYLILGENGRKGMTMHPRIAVSDNSALFGPAYQMILNPDVLQE